MDIMNTKRSGASLLEYVLPLTFVVAVVATTLSDNNIIKKLTDYLAGSSMGSVHQHTLNVPALGTVISHAQRVDDSVQTALTSQSASSAQQQICLSSGICLNIPVIASGDGTLSETVGGLGGNLTNALGNVLDQIVQQLKAQNADPTLVQLITNLALEGHGLGNHINSLEQQCPINSTCTLFRSTLQGSAGNGYKASLEGSNNFFTANIDTGNFQKAYQAVQDYFSAHPHAYADVANVINQESSQILNISNGVTVGGNVYSVVKTSANNAQLVHQDSNTICASDGNQGICKKST